jgi:hypothetical protein
MVWRKRISKQGTPFEDAATGSLRELLCGSKTRQLSLRAHEDHTIFALQIFDPHAVQFPLVSHPGITHQDHDVTEEFKASTVKRLLLVLSQAGNYC